MDLNLKNCRIVVTGGASGIGEAIVRGLALEGALPVIVDRNRDTAEKLAQTLREQNVECETLIADLSSAEACRNAARELQKSGDSIDGLVNNAGVNDGVGLEEGDPERFRRSLERNLTHVYLLTSLCLPALGKSKGSIVNISSKTAVTGQGGTSGYVAAKAAILGLTREWAGELRSRGIRVNAVVPAEVLTPQYESWIAGRDNPEKERKRIASAVPLGQRFTRPQEIADTVLFLLSGRSSHTTGQWIHVDGGYVHLDRALKPDPDRGEES